MAGIGGIVSPELVDTLREILSDSERGHAHQCYVLLLMQMLADGDPLPALTDVLEETVHDATWYPSVRCGVLDVLTGYNERNCLDSATLQQMVGEIDAGSINDPQDELLGILLKSLYPRVLSMAEVMKYLRAPKLKEQIGEYSKFWTEHVHRQSTPEQLAELLDGIVASFEDCKGFMLGEVGTNTRMARLPVEALEQVLRDTRGRVVPHRFYNWLCMFSGNGFQVLDRDVSSLRFSLQWDAEALKALIAHGRRDVFAQGRAVRRSRRPAPVRGPPVPIRAVVRGNGACSGGPQSGVLLCPGTCRLPDEWNPYRGDDRRGRPPELGGGRIAVEAVRGDGG